MMFSNLFNDHGRINILVDSQVGVLQQSVSCAVQQSIVRFIKAPRMSDVLVDAECRHLSVSPCEQDHVGSNGAMEVADHGNDGAKGWMLLWLADAFMVKSDVQNYELFHRFRPDS